MSVLAVKLLIQRLNNRARIHIGRHSLRVRLAPILNLELISQVPVLSDGGGNCAQLVIYVRSKINHRQFSILGFVHLAAIEARESHICSLVILLVSADGADELLLLLPLVELSCRILVCERIEISA